MKIECKEDINNVREETTTTKNCKGIEWTPCNCVVYLEIQPNYNYWNGRKRISNE